MEPFLNLPGLTIQKIAKDNVASQPEVENGSPGQEASSNGNESGEDDARQEETSGSDIEDEVESEESDDDDESKDSDQLEASAEEVEETDKADEENLADDKGDHAQDDKCKEEKVQVEEKSPVGGNEVELHDSRSQKESLSASKSNKRKKNTDSEKDAVKKKKRKRKTKEHKKDDGSDSDSEDNKKVKKKRVKNLRKNIREVMNEDELDEETKAAQRQEMERLRRVQEQQKMLKEMQRKIMMEKQKSLLQSLGQSPSILNNCTITPMGANRVLETGQLPAFQSLTAPEMGITPAGTSASLKKSSESESSDDDDDDINFYDPSVAGVAGGLVMESRNVPQSIKESAEPKELVTISSSDDDCMIVSGGSDAESEPEDPTNSGLHTNDVFNIPDEQGRVLINVGHPENEPDIFLAPQVARVIKSHQIGGIRFLFDNVVESLERCKTSAGFGCILAHSMGLGKTLQVVSFCDIFLRHTNSKHILCIMPINTLQNWLAEFNMWMPAETTENGGTGSDHEVRPRNFKLHVLNDSQKTLTARAKVIRLWHSDGGVLLIGYELYRLLSLRRDKMSKKRKFTPIIEIEEDDNRKKALWNEIHNALVKPGPDLVICDEGHRIKNSHASISHALKSIQTKRRVVLTGYPLQNNLLEYWCMVDFVRPNYLGTKTEFCNMFERPIQNGQCVDSTPNDVKLMRYRAHVLHSLLNGFVQRRSHEVLQKALPKKNEYVLLFRMTPFQRKLYSVFMNEVVRTKAVPNPLKAFAVCCKIWNHPDVLYYFLKKRMEGDDLDLEDPVVANNAGNAAPATPVKTGKASRTKKTAPEAQEPGNEAKLDAVVKPMVQTQDSSQSAQSQGYQNQYNQNFGYGESSNQFGQQYQQNYADNMSQCYQQQTNQFQVGNDQPSPYNSLPSAQNFRQQQQQCWTQSCYAQNQSSFSNQFEDPYGLLPTTLDQKQSLSAKNETLMGLIEKKGSGMDNKEIESIEKMIDEKIERQKEEEIKSLLEHGSNMPKSGRDETTIPYDWATEILKGYEPGKIENSAKMEALFCILDESLKIGDRILLFSQSLFTLNLIEDFLHQNIVPGTNEKWAKSVHYFRLDGSTAAIEREKLINEFNANPKLSLFLVSTRAGSLGINLVGANRVIVFDASWNPCHDTQAVCRVYRYGQIKQCYVYRFVMDKCLEKKIYDRQINKQGMADRVVDELNPDAHLSMKEVSNLLYDSEPETEPLDLSEEASKYSTDSVLQNMLKRHGTILTKSPFQHESLLVDRKDKKLSQAEKRLAKRSYELEKQASTRPGFNNYYGGYQGSYSTSGGGIINAPPATLPIRHGTRPVASVRPMPAPRPPPTSRTRWIPAETWQRQGMTVQEMTLPIDVVIPTNAQDRSISLKAGQRVMVLKSPKGVYMQLDNGKIIAIRSTPKTGEQGSRSTDVLSKVVASSNSTPDAIKNLLPPNSELTITPRTSSNTNTRQSRQFPWNSSSSFSAPDVMDMATSSNSGSSSSSTGLPLTFDNQLLAMEQLSALTEPQVKPPNQHLQNRMPPKKDDSFPLPASSSKKAQFPAAPSYSVAAAPEMFVPDEQQGSSSMSQQFLQSSMRTSGGGIVATNPNQDPNFAAAANYNQNYAPNAFNQQQYSDSYSAFHRPEFPGTPAPNNQYTQYGFGNNPYQAPDLYAPPPYPTENYTYQQPNFNPMYSSSSQSGHHYSHPQS